MTYTIELIRKKEGCRLPIGFGFAYRKQVICFDFFKDLAAAACLLSKPHHHTCVYHMGRLMNEGPTEQMNKGCISCGKSNMALDFQAWQYPGGKFSENPHHTIVLAGYSTFRLPGGTFFLPEKTFFLAEKTFFSPKKTLLPPGKTSFLAEKTFFLAGKTFFLAQKTFFSSDHLHQYLILSCRFLILTQSTFSVTQK